jgi:hypothetical protein
MGKLLSNLDQFESVASTSNINRIGIERFSETSEVQKG